MTFNDCYDGYDDDSDQGYEGWYDRDDSDDAPDDEGWDDDDGYTDAEADADTLRSAGYGMDEDYNYGAEDYDHFG